MTQLIVSNLVLPETTGDKYRAYPAPLEVQVDMISGRRVTELRGNVWWLEYQYDYLPTSILRPLYSVLRSSQPFNVVFLPDNGNELVPERMMRVSMSNPQYAFSRHGMAYWHDVSFRLRGVRPFD